VPLTQIACLGLSHQTAPIDLRERMSYALQRQDPLDPAHLGDRFSALSEIAMLATCNRIELYAYVDAACSNPQQLLLDYLGAYHEADLSIFPDYLYFYTGPAAAAHLLGVATGLDSQILGEPQILGQVTGAFMQAVEANLVGPALTILFRNAIRAGKRARAETAISSNPASISSVSIRLADRVVGDLQKCRVLVIGLGDMGQLALKALRKRGVQNIALANRTRERAQRLEFSRPAPVFGLDELATALKQADVVISATAAPHMLVDRALLESVMSGRDDRDLVIIDIAMPRDVNPDVRDLPHVHLYNMDDLRETLDQALAARRSEIPRVQAIITGEMANLEREFRELAVSPIIVDLRQKAEAIRQHELQRTLRYLGEDIDPETLKHVQHLSRSLVNKILHEPTIRLRQQASDGQADKYATAVRDLFDLNNSGEG